MSIIRSEVSLKNPYYIPKHRYYELKHFCLQYPIWNSARNSLIGLQSNGDLGVFVQQGITDPTERCAESIIFYTERIDMIRKAAEGTLIPKYIFKAVTQNLTYTYFEMNCDLMITRDQYYSEYRKFFYLLSKIRK